MNGFYLDGSHFIVRNNTVTGVLNGIQALGSDILVQNNVIDGFIQDGMDWAGSNSTFRGNLVKNVVETTFGFHSDGFQSFTGGGGAAYSGLTLENNTIIEWTYDLSSPLRGGLQGIGMFDGWYDNLIIRNNVVVTDMGHGISVYGTHNATIVNNTVVSISGMPAKWPWIMVTTLKDGSPSQNVLVANNVAMAMSVPSDPVTNIVATNNSVIVDPALAFKDVKNFNYRPTPASGFLDSADRAYAPRTDILGAARPFGIGPDRGAYEVGAASP